jgi:hypothetical protein
MVKRGYEREPLFGRGYTLEARTVDLELFLHLGWLPPCSPRCPVAVPVRGIGSVAGVAMADLGSRQRQFPAWTRIEPQ